MTGFDWRKASEHLRHVYWLGGASSAGKSTISSLLEKRRGMIRYDGDGRLLGEYIKKFSRERAPVCHEHLERSKTEGEKFYWNYPPRKYRELMYAVYTEDLAFVVEDLLALSSEFPIVVDMFGGYPTEELFHLTPLERLIFLIPTPEFHRKDYGAWFERNDTRRKLSSIHPNADEMMANYVRGHLEMADHIRRECDKRRLPHLITGGNMGVEEVYAAVCDHFGFG